MARISFRCGDELLRAVDESRGLIPRETFVRELVQAAIASKTLSKPKPPEIPVADAFPEDEEAPAVPPPGERPRGKGTFQPYPKP